jgi:hypothetical protein
MDERELQYRGTQNRPDGTPGPAKGPAPALAALGRGDKLAAPLGAAAIFFSAFSLFFGPPSEAGGAPFVWTAPLVAFLFFVALVAMFVEPVRHGIARALFSGGALVELVAGFVFLSKVPAGRVIFFYWLPALLALGAALALTRAHRAARGVAVTVRRSRPPRARR